MAVQAVHKVGASATAKWFADRTRIAASPISAGHRLFPALPVQSDCSRRIRLFLSALGGRTTVSEFKQACLCLTVPLSPPLKRVGIARRNFSIPHASAATLGSSNDEATHNQKQQEHYDSDYAAYIQEVPPKVTESLQKIVQAANLKPSDKVLDCGCGAGRLIPHLLAAGVEDIVAVDLSIMMIALVKEQFDGVRCWQGDVVDLPPTFGPFDAIFVNEVLECVHSQEAVLKAVARLLQPGGAVIISHSEGRRVSDFYRKKRPELQPHSLPDSEGLEKLAESAGLDVESFTDADDSYLAGLRNSRSSTESPEPSKKTTALDREDDPYYFAKAPLYMKTPVVSGFGRGSRQLGFPTANMAPELLTKELDGLMNGVYFGWARLVADGKDDTVYKMVMNVGNRPTFADGAGQTIEVHVLNKYETDFYGDEMRVVVLGCIRPEQKFASVEDLVTRIKADVAITEEALEDDSKRAFSRDPFLLG